MGVANWTINYVQRKLSERPLAEYGAAAICTVYYGHHASHGHNVFMNIMHNIMNMMFSMDMMNFSMYVMEYITMMPYMGMINYSMNMMQYITMISYVHKHDVLHGYDEQQHEHDGVH